MRFKCLLLLEPHRMGIATKSTFISKLATIDEIKNDSYL